MKKEELDAIKIRASKYLKEHDIPYSDIMKLCDAVLALREENSLLRQNLFELEQEVPDEQQWHNVIANKLERAILAQGGKEFLEIHNSINNTTFTISIQKKYGNTPQQLLEKSEIRRLKAIQKIVNLTKEINILKNLCAKNSVEIKILSSIGKPSIDQELVVRDKIDTTIKALKEVITSYNSTVYSRNLPKLHISMKNVLQEAMQRASICSSKLLKVEEENKLLKKAILKRKNPLCRIYKKRRKGKSRHLALH